MLDTSSIMGFTYNGVHCSQFGILAKVRDMPFIAEAKTAFLDASDRDGSFSFSGINQYTGGVRTCRKDSSIQIECRIVETDIMLLNNKMSEIAAWLGGTAEGKLTLDSVPDVYWNVSIYERFSFVPMRYGVTTAFALSFRAFPYSMSNELTTVTLGSGNTYSGAYKGQPTPIKINAQGGTAAGSIVSVTVTDTYSGGSLYCGYSNTATTKYTNVVIDAQTCSCSDNGINTLQYFTGEFLYLPSSSFAITNSSSTAITISWRERWFYGKLY
ncbi:hypothetical protein AGMMS49975_15090 [Clostridia bacterium]|nr:hypothetical protein AGMMS49975_15090 [Clostridia bacterium]